MININENAAILGKIFFCLSFSKKSLSKKYSINQNNHIIIVDKIHEDNPNNIKNPHNQNKSLDIAIITNIKQITYAIMKDIHIVLINCLCFMPRNLFLIFFILFLYSIIFFLSLFISSICSISSSMIHSLR